MLFDRFLVTQPLGLRLPVLPLSDFAIKGKAEKNAANLGSSDLNAPGKERRDGVHCERLRVKSSHCDFSHSLDSEEFKHDGLTVLLFLLISLAKGRQQQESKLLRGGTSPEFSRPEATTLKPNPGSLSTQDKTLLPIYAGEKDGGSGLVEVKEDEIPEGSPVYVLEEPESQTTDVEIMQTANNIVFRPLFRYRGKQEALRRNGQRVRRRYFVPRRSYRQTYRYPYFY